MEDQCDSKASTRCPWLDLAQLGLCPKALVRYREADPLGLAAQETKVRPKTHRAIGGGIRWPHQGQPILP
jgi:hypothetical protein